MRVHRLLITALFAGAFVSAAHAEEKLPAPELADNGLHVRPWFFNSFLEFGDDVAEVGAEGMKLIVFIAQTGCSYGRELHQVNLCDPEIVAYLNDHSISVPRSSMSPADTMPKACTSTLS